MEGPGRPLDPLWKMLVVTTPAAIWPHPLGKGEERLINLL
jgi:hypothetical protein